MIKPFKVRLFALLQSVLLLCAFCVAPARAADPIKVGFSMALTGAVAPNGRQLLISLEIWRDDVNAAGGSTLSGGGEPICIRLSTARLGGGPILR